MTTRGTPAPGFTLIEMVISIAALGVLAAAAALFLRGPIASFFDTERRADLAESSLLTAARLADDLAHAVPNSVRVRNAGGRVYIEFLPLRRDNVGEPSQGRYRGGGPGDALTPGASDTSFDVLGFPLAAQNGDWIVINNHAPGANVWGGNTRVRYTGPGGVVNTMSFAAHTFPADSSERRFQVATQPVSYVCDPAAGQLRRIEGYGDPVSAQPLVFGAGASNRQLAEDVRRCSALALPGTLRQAQRLAVEIGFENTGERLTLARTLRVGTLP